jgi:hypothetical protein
MIAQRLAAVTLCALTLGGCAGAVIGLGLLMACGPMPMSPSDCRPTRGNTKPQTIHPTQEVHP